MLSEKYGVSLPRSNLITAERQSKCRNLFNDYLVLAKRHLQVLVKDVKRLIMSNNHQMEIRGEVSEDRQQQSEQLTANCRKLYDSLSTLSDLLDSEPLVDFNLMIKGIIYFLICLNILVFLMVIAQCFY